MSRYRAFLSYSHSDAKFAAALHRDLERFRVPADIGKRLGLVGNRIGTIFRDVDELGAATKLDNALVDALRESGALIVICSNEATTSKWVEQEVLEFRKVHGNAARILAVIPPDAGSGPVEDIFPAALGEAPPLAADARKNADGKRLALLKIVAGLLKLGLDELIRRDARRRHTRLVIGTFVSTAIALTMTVLAGFAISAREDSQRRLSQSEDLVRFMLGDLRGELAEVGQIRVLESVGDKALEYFDSLEDSDLTDEALLRKSRALYQIGDVYFELGQFESAMISFQSSLEQARQLATAQPENSERLFELAQAEFWVGYAADALGDLDLSERHLTAYRDAAHLLVERDSANEDWAMEAFWSSNNLGTLAMRRSRFGEAQAYFEDAISRINKLIGREASPDRLLERATIFSWLGTTHFRRGNLTAARDAFVQALDRPIDLTNALDEEERAYEHGFLSDVETVLGNLDAALLNANQAAAISARLADADPDNMDLLYAKTAQNLRTARLALFNGNEVRFAQLRSAADRLLERQNSPSLWKLAALGIADVGVRAAEPGATEWARSLLGSGADIESGRAETEREHLDLLVSLAQVDTDVLEQLTGTLSGAIDQYEASRDFELVLPIYRAYMLLGDEAGYTRMRAVLDAAGSKHPDFVTNLRR
jgi:tetratricopeptide (TPR) repeat protein